MLPRLLWPAALLCLSFHLAMAQDPAKVEPKHYKVQFENDHVQVVNVHYGPHEKSDMHDHPGGVVVIVTGGHLRFTDPNGKVTEVYSKAGEARWFPPFRHKVENVGNEAYNAVYIGLKGKGLTTVVGAAQDSATTDREIAQAILAYAEATAKTKP
jgi:quercetin dioxygenase-like cupin family protein